MALVVSDPLLDEQTVQSEENGITQEIRYSVHVTGSTNDLSAYSGPRKLNEALAATGLPSFGS